MRKSKIKIRADAIAQSKAQELAQLAADNWHNQSPQLYNNDIDTDNKVASVNLAKFGLFGKTFFAAIIRGVCKKWLLNDYMISNKTNLITSMITNLGTGVANHFEESVVIRSCQVLKVDKPNENDVKKILEETVQN